MATKSNGKHGGATEPKRTYLSQTDGILTGLLSVRIDARLVSARQFREGSGSVGKCLREINALASS
jgi:hypothetical protein